MTTRSSQEGETTRTRTFKIPLNQLGPILVCRNTVKRVLPKGWLWRLEFDGTHQDFEEYRQLQLGELAKEGEDFCPFEAIKKYPYTYIGVANRQTVWGFQIILVVVLRIVLDSFGFFWSWQTSKSYMGLVSHAWYSIQYSWWPIRSFKLTNLQFLHSSLDIRIQPTTYPSSTNEAVHPLPVDH